MRDEELVAELAAAVGCPVRTDPEALERAARDETEDLRFLPLCVAEPRTTDEVSAVLRWAHGRGIPVTPAGARTGLSGGALAAHGGVSLSLRRMNAIVAID